MGKNVQNWVKLGQKNAKKVKTGTNWQKLTQHD